MSHSQSRQVIQGISASPGIALGPAVVMDTTHLVATRHHIDSSDISHEIQRLEKAIRDSQGELEQIRDRLGKKAPVGYRLILDAHLMMHGDESIVETALEMIKLEEINAEWALQRVIDGIVHQLDQAPESYLRERAEDVKHVGNRILGQLSGRASFLPKMTKGAVLVVDDLSPADAVHLMEMQVCALVTELGSIISHTAILARTLEIPTIVGVGGVTARIGNGDLVIVDALKGEVILGATNEEREDARNRDHRYRRFTDELRKKGAVHVKTHDDVPIELMANIELPAEAALAVQEQAQGIGLYRTEFILTGSLGFLSEDEQVEIYFDVVRVMSPRPVVFRTFDAQHISNPKKQTAVLSDSALGLRAIRFALRHPEQFLDQLRAVLRSAVYGPVRLMFPLVSSMEEMRSALFAVQQARADLDERNVVYGDVSIGVLIELPAAVMISDRLAQECDFLSVGTNDLVQYTLAVGRTDPMLAHLANPMHPAVLRLLEIVATVAKQREISLSMCGGMASDAFALPLAVGLGYHNLSVAMSSLPVVREILRRLDTQQAHWVAHEALNAATTSEVSQLIVEHYKSSLGDIWAEAGIKECG